MCFHYFSLRKPLGFGGLLWQLPICKVSTFGNLLFQRKVPQAVLDILVGVNDVYFDFKVVQFSQGLTLKVSLCFYFHNRRLSSLALIDHGNVVDWARVQIATVLEIFSVVLCLVEELEVVLEFKHVFRVYTLWNFELLEVLLLVVVELVFGDTPLVFFDSRLPIPMVNCGLESA